MTYIKNTVSIFMIQRTIDEVRLHKLETECELKILHAKLNETKSLIDE